MERSSIVDVKNSIRWDLWKVSLQIEDTWVWTTQYCLRILRYGNSSEDIGSQLSKVDNHGERKKRSETSIAKLWRQTRENWDRSSGQESKGREWRWKRKRYMLPVERRRPGIRVMIVHQNRHRQPLHPLSQQWHEIEERRGKEAPEAEVRLAELFDNRADIVWKFSVRDHLVSDGILPNVNSLKTNRDAEQVTSVCWTTTK